jgi:hypothetical protein
MFRLIRLLISLAMTAVFIWFAVTVPLGKHTLWGHLRAIFGTQEARDLAEGTREQAHKVADRVREELHPVDMAAPSHTAHEVAETPATAPAPAAPSPIPVERPHHHHSSPAAKKAH